jgi:hypothetical protein
MQSLIKCRGCGGSGIAGALQSQGQTLARDPGQPGFGQACALCGGDGYYPQYVARADRNKNLNEQ